MRRARCRAVALPPLAACAAAAAGSAVYLSALQLRFSGEEGGARDSSEEDEDTAFSDADILWGTMAVTSALPVFSPMAWVLGWVGTGERRFLAFALMYGLPSLAALGAVVGDEGSGGSGTAFLATALCAAHVQLERVAATETLDELERPTWLPKVPAGRGVTLPFFGGTDSGNSQAEDPLERSSAMGAFEKAWTRRSLAARLAAEDQVERASEAASAQAEAAATAEWDKQLARRSATVRELRAQCKAAGVPGAVSRMRKAELLEALQAVDQRRKAEDVLEEEMRGG